MTETMGRPLGTYSMLNLINKASEAQIQKTIVDYISLKHKDLLIFHVPNAGKRSFQTGIFLKRQGLLKGIPDVCILWKGRCGFLEIKTPTGRLSSHQRAILDRMTALHIPNAVVRSLDEAIEVLHNWGIKT